MVFTAEEDAAIHTVQSMLLDNVTHKPQPLPSMAIVTCRQRNPCIVIAVNLQPCDGLSPAGNFKEWDK